MGEQSSPMINFICIKPASIFCTMNVDDVDFKPTDLDFPNNFYFLKANKKIEKILNKYNHQVT